MAGAHFSNSEQLWLAHAFFDVRLNSQDTGYDTYCDVTVFNYPFNFYGGSV